MANRTSCTAAKQAGFLDVLAETGIVSTAAEAAGIPRRTIYHHRETDPEFARQWDKSLQIGLDTLQEEAIRRARDGVIAGVYQGGIQIGTERKYSDLLLMFLLRSRGQKDQTSPELAGKIIDAEISPQKISPSFRRTKKNSSLPRQQRP